jgi:D-alanyl-D-alanine carboxypeptidase
MERCTVRRKRLNFIAAMFFFAATVMNLLPSTKVYAVNNELPKLNGKAAASMDMETGEIIFALNLDEKMYPASMTKLLTALLLADNKSKTDLIKYTESAKAQPQYSLSTDIMPRIKIGDTMSAEDVMKALLLFSANDSAYMIADGVGGNAENFRKMMNERAATLSMKNSSFVSPNGLHHPEHYTTAYDMLLLIKEAYANPWVKEAMGLKTDTIRTTSGIVARTDNRNKLVGKAGNVGGKTGYTRAAGRCLVAVYERDGRTIATVVMRSAYDAEDTMVFKDTEAVANWSFAAKRTPLYDKDAIVKTETVTYKPFKFFGPKKTVQVPVVVKEEPAYYENDINKKEIKSDISIEPVNPWRLSQDTKIGTLAVTQRGGTVSYDLYPTISAKDVRAANRNLYIFSAAAVIAVLVLLVIVILLIRKSFGRRNRRNRRYRY